MYYYQSTNPCICSSPSPENPCPDDCNCLKVCNIAINAMSDDAVGPCAQVGTLDISDTEVYGHDFCACGADPVVWSIESYDKEQLVHASITNDGVLSWTTAGPETVESYPCVIVRVCCGKLSAYGFVLIGIKDECKNCSACPGGCEECNPCDGTCTGGTVDATIKGVNTPANNSIQGS